MEVLLKSNFFDFFLDQTRVPVAKWRSLFAPSIRGKCKANFMAEKLFNSLGTRRWFFIAIEMRYSINWPTPTGHVSSLTDCPHVYERNPPATTEIFIYCLKFRFNLNFPFLFVYQFPKNVFFSKDFLQKFHQKLSTATVSASPSQNNERSGWMSVWIMWS